MRVTQPNRVTRTYTQHLVAPPERIFPLLCPVREADWIEGWNPVLVLSETGVAERDCVFITEAAGGNAIWYVTRHAPERGIVEMIKITPGVTACKLRIELAAAGTGATAQVTYMHTSLGPQGDAFIHSFSEEHYSQFMRDWEERINHYLSTGSMLRSAPA